MKTITKKEAIESLGEKISALKLKRGELIDQLFDVAGAAEEKINELKKFGLIDTTDWDVSWYRGKYNNYLMYRGEIIERSSGFYDGGDFNYRVAPTDYGMLLEFVSKSAEIVQGMTEALEEKLSDIEKITSNK